MFKKIGSIIQAEKTSLAEWRNMIVSAEVKQKPEDIKSLAEFDLDRNNFLYVRTRAVSCYELHGPNQNSDAFRADTLASSHKTFVRRGAYINHESDSPEKAIGIILDASWHPKQGFVQTLIAIDRSEPISAKIERGIANKWSMGALVERCVCSVCEKTAHSIEDYCDHLANYMGHEYNGRKVFAFNEGVSFYEESNVTIPADSNADTLQVLAAKKNPKKFDVYLGLSDTYNARIEAAARKKDPVLRDVKGKLQQDQSPRTDKQILGKVRHKLKVATAKLVQPQSSALHQRVQSALEAGDTSVEQTNKKTSETNLTEGLKVENALTIRYIPGDTLKECYFIARKGKLQAHVSASDVLDSNTQSKIVKAEKGAQKIKDDSKPNPDNKHELGKDPSQPSDALSKSDTSGSKQIKDDSKPSPDNKHELGKDPHQPSDVVKKYAQLIGAKNVTFKKGGSGSFTATLSNGSIARLASLWNTSPKLVRTVKKQAKIGGQPMAYAREDAELLHTKPREKMSYAREDKSKDMAKPSGSTGKEIKQYFQGLNSGNLAQGGDQAWARKVADLTKKAAEQDKQIKALQVENGTYKKALEAEKMDRDNEKKAAVVTRIIGFMEKVGALKVSADAVIDLQERGLDRKDAEAKAFADMIDAKKAELKQFDLAALEAMAKNMSEVAPAVQKKASLQGPSTFPVTGRDEQSSSSDEDRLASSW